MAMAQDKADGGQLFNDFYLRFVEDDFKEEPDRICALFRPVYGSSHVVACNVTWRISNLWNVLEVSNCCSCNKTCILPKSWAILGQSFSRSIWWDG